MSAHTPGPWTVGGRSSTNFGIRAEGRMLGYVLIVDSVETAEANARLIAAAPMLAEALQVIVKDARASGFTAMEWLPLAETALAEAGL